MTDIILTFKDQQYPLAKVKAKGMSGPPVEAKFEEMNISEEALAMVQLSATTVEVLDGPVILYKHEGKYLVFSGIVNVHKAVAAGKPIKGHLLTSFALKSVRIEKPIAESAYIPPVKPQAVEQLANKFNSSPRPAPRPYDNKTPRPSYGSNNRTAPRQASGNTLHARSGGNRSGS